MSSELMMEGNRKVITGEASRVEINAETGPEDANKAGSSIVARAESSLEAKQKPRGGTMNM